MATPGHLLLLAATLLLLLLSSASADDTQCLTHLHSLLIDPANSLRNWTSATFASPCSASTSFLRGATCSNGRVYSLSLPNLSLSGSLSPSLSNCTSLRSLDLSSNLLRGPIPPQLAQCTFLNVIDLHGNELSGQIPTQLGLLPRLSVFDVSGNRLSGPIPGTLGRFNASSYAGNEGLYGYPLAGAGSGGLTIGGIVGIGLGSGLVSLVLSFAAVCVWLRVSDGRKSMEEEEEEGKVSQSMPEY